eukprot:366430-Chlamydomonas_euryale.AAC.3
MSSGGYWLDLQGFAGIGLLGGVRERLTSLLGRWRCRLVVHDGPRRTCPRCPHFPILSSRFHTCPHVSTRAHPCLFPQAKKSHRSSNPIYNMLPDILSHLSRERSASAREAEAIMEVRTKAVQAVLVHTKTEVQGRACSHKNRGAGRCSLTQKQRCRVVLVHTKTERCRAMLTHAKTEVQGRAGSHKNRGAGRAGSHKNRGAGSCLFTQKQRCRAMLTHTKTEVQGRAGSHKKGVAPVRLSDWLCRSHACFRAEKA